MAKFCGKDEKLFMMSTHAFGHFVCILNDHSQLGEKKPRQEPRHRLGILAGNYPLHDNYEALIMNPCTGIASPQFHLIFDDNFITVPYFQKVTQAKQKHLHENQATHAAHQEINDSLLFSFDNDNTSVSEGDVPDLTKEDSISVCSSPPNEG